MENKKILKETIVYFFGTMIISILGFVLSLMYSKMFSPYDYGLYSLVFSTYTLVSQIYCSWLPNSLIRNAEAYENNNKKDELYGTAYQTLLYLSIFFLLVCNLIIWILNIELLAKWMFSIFTIIFFFEQTILLTNTMLRVRQEAKQYSKNNIINSSLKIIAILVLYYVLNYRNIVSIAIGLLISEVIQYVYLYKKMKLRDYYSRKNFKLDIVKSMFKYGFPLMGVSITTWILSVSDRYIIQLFYSAQEVGLYSYAYSLSNSIFSLLMQFIMLGAYPNIIKTWENEGKDSTIKIIKKYLKIYLLIILPACFGVCAVAKQFFIALTDVRYHESYNVFIITSFGIALLGLTQYTNKVWELNKNTKMILIINVIVACVNLVLNFILIPIVGYAVGALTTLIAYLVYLLISIILSRHILKLEIDIKSFSRVLISSIIMYISIVTIDKMININDILKLVVEVLSGLIIYGVMLLVLKEIKLSDIKIKK